MTRLTHNLRVALMALCLRMPRLPSPRDFAITTIIGVCILAGQFVLGMHQYWWLVLIGLVGFIAGCFMPRKARK